MCSLEKLLWLHPFTQGKWVSRWCRQMSRWTRRAFVISIWWLLCPRGYTQDSEQSCRWWKDNRRLTLRDAKDLHNQVSKCLTNREGKGHNGGQVLISIIDQSPDSSWRISSFIHPFIREENGHSHYLVSHSLADPDKAPPLGWLHTRSPISNV